MIEKSIDQITEKDIQSLIENMVPEGKTIEYKQSLPDNSEPSKKEFLADVSSFANASGGDIIYGIAEEKGIPKSLLGLNIDPDQEILRLEQIIRSRLEPRIIGIVTRAIPLSDSKNALVIRIPKSWNSPHRIRESHEFYSRSSNGKYRLDVAELRVAFNLSETITERIRNFRLDRLSKIMANETPVPFYDNTKIVLHLIPLISFNPAQVYDIVKVAEHHTEMKPIYCAGWHNRYNLDGFLNFAKDKEGKTYSYVQFFRNGIIEAVDGLLLEPRGDRLLIPSVAYEEKLIISLKSYLALLKELSVEPPAVTFLSLLGVKGYSMALSDSYRVREIHHIDRDVLMLPEVIIEDYDIIPEKTLRPTFDAIWNACGLPRSFNYNEKGEWAPPR